MNLSLPPKGVFVARGETREEMSLRVVGALDQILRSTGYQISEEWLQIRLTMPQGRLLLVLLAEERMRMSDLAAALGSTFSAATGLVDRLVERKLLERQTDPEDRRTVLCCLTSSGRELAVKLLEIRHLQWGERLRPLTLEELAQVAEAMELIVAASQRAVQESPPVRTG